MCIVLEFPKGLQIFKSSIYSPIEKLVSCTPKGVFSLYYWPSWNDPYWQGLLLWSKSNFSVKYDSFIVNKLSRTWISETETKLFLWVYACICVFSWCNHWKVLVKIDISPVICRKCSFKFSAHKWIFFIIASLISLTTQSSTWMWCFF